MIDRDAIIALDCGANTHFAARHLRAKSTQKLALSGMLASMGPGLPFSIAAKLAYPTRQCVAIVGDGGFATLMAEFTTAVRLERPIKVLLLKNNVLGEVQFEQRDLGFPRFGCKLGEIDFQEFSLVCGGDGIQVHPTRRADAHNSTCPRESQGRDHRGIGRSGRASFDPPVTAGIDVTSWSESRHRMRSPLGALNAAFGQCGKQSARSLDFARDS
ncbi:MAG: thiamine pyrophosphate-dependent enzyme [Burkholderiaceae bacterium]